MRYLRIAIMVMGCLLVGLCVLFPACSSSDDIIGPHLLWIVDALKPTHDYIYRTDIVWLAILIEIGLCVSFTSVLYLTTFFRGEQAVLFVCLALFCPLMVGVFGHLDSILGRSLLVNYWVLLFMECYIWIAFIRGNLFLRKQAILKAQSYL